MSATAPTAVDPMQNAKDMSPDEWRAARELAASGGLPSPAAALKLRITADVAEAERARAAAAASPPGNTGSTQSPPPPASTATEGQRVLQMSRSEFAAAARAKILEADGTRGFRSSIEYALYGR